MQCWVHEAYGVPNEDEYTHCTGSWMDSEIAMGKQDSFVDWLMVHNYHYMKVVLNSQLSFIIRLLHLKCLRRLNNKVFNMLLCLYLVREAFLDAMVGLPKSYYEANKLMNDVKLDYEKLMLVQMIALCIGGKWKKNFMWHMS